MQDITELGARGQIDRRRKLRQEVIRHVEIDIEPLQVAPILLLDRVNDKVGKDKAAFLVIGMRKRIETLWEKILLPDLVRARRR